LGIYFSSIKVIPKYWENIIFQNQRIIVICNCRRENASNQRFAGNKRIDGEYVIAYAQKGKRYSCYNLHIVNEVVEYMKVLDVI
jgi:hypothetical protein